MQINKYKGRISAHDFVVVGKDIYFFSLNCNGLYCLHMPKRQLEFLGSVPHEEFQKRHLYGAITEFNGKLYMPPMNAKEIAVYDIGQRKFDKITLQYKDKDKGAKFFGALYGNRKLFFIPCWYRYLVVLDLDSGQVIYLDGWRHKFDMKGKGEERFVRNGAFIKDGILYMASMIDNSLIEISTKSYEARIIEIGNDRDGFADMCFDEQKKCIWFLKKSKPVIEKWDLESFEIKSYEVTLDSFKQTGEYPFINLICDQDNVYLISFQSNMSVVMDKERERFLPAEWDIGDNKNIDTEWDARNYFAKKLGKDVFVVGTIGELSFFLIQKGKMIDKIHLEDPLLIYRYNYQRGKIIREDGIFCIEDFLKMLTMQEKVNGKDYLKISSGSKIYLKIKEREK